MHFTAVGFDLTVGQSTLQWIAEFITEEYSTQLFQRKAYCSGPLDSKVQNRSDVSKDETPALRL